MKYSSDLEKDFVEEILHFKNVICGKGIIFAPLLLQLFREQNLQEIFQNKDFSLKHYLTFSVTNASESKKESDPQ